MYYYNELNIFTFHGYVYTEGIHTHKYNNQNKHYGNSLLKQEHDI